MNITEELKQELENAIYAYEKVLRKASLGVDTPGFEGLLKCKPSELSRKLRILKDFYKQL